MKSLPTPESGAVNRVIARRRFAQNMLAAGTLTGLASIFPQNAFAQERKRGRVPSLDTATLPETTLRELKTNCRATFQAVLSDYFQTTDGFGAPVSLLLLEINDLPEQRKRLAQTSLSAARAQ